MSRNEAMERKLASQEVLAREGIPFIEHLPLLPDSGEVVPRTLEEVGDRAICLALVAAAAEGLEPEVVEKKSQEFEVTGSFSPQEQAFLAQTSPDQRTRAQFLWRYESLWVLLWALGFVEQLEIPRGICDVPRAVGTIVSRGRTRFLAEARLRPVREILDQADLIYRMHWATTEARIHQKPMPANLDNDTVYERHYALNWLIRDQDADWDAVQTHT